jgi:hypothetical protein
VCILGQIYLCFCVCFLSHIVYPYAVSPGDSGTLHTLCELDSMVLGLYVVVTNLEELNKLKECSIMKY